MEVFICLDRNIYTINTPLKLNLYNNKKRYLTGLYMHLLFYHANVVSCLFYTFIY